MNSNLEKYLDELQKFGIKLGLENTAQLFCRANAPLKNGYIHIAGTNGKGSCGAMLECALRSVGFKTGFYSSPHLIDIRERFRVNGRAVSSELLEESFQELKVHSDAMTKEGTTPTYFEFTTALAAKIFADAKVDFVIWETGMGGRYDSTNVVTPELTLITNISIDHKEYLGSTCAEIAYEKAGIIKPNIPTFAGFFEDGMEVIEQACKEVGTTLKVADLSKLSKATFGSDEQGMTQEFKYDNLAVKLHMQGSMQRNNFAAIYPILEHLSSKYNFDLKQAVGSLVNARWPGRYQMVNQRLIIDGGHNPDGVVNILSGIEECFNGEKFTIIFAGFKDKDVKSSLAVLTKIAKKFIFVPIANIRTSYTPEELSEISHSISETPCVGANSGAEALKLAQEGCERILAVGSLYLAGEILELTAPETVFDLT